MKERERLRLLKARNNDEAGKAKKSKDKKKKKKSVTVERGTYAETLLQAGIPLSPVVWLTIIIGGALFLMSTVTKVAGPLIGILIGPCFLYYFLSLYITARSEKRRREAVPHLPAFVDTLAASLGTGYNMELALQHAATALPKGLLKKEIERAITLIDKGISLDEALTVLGSRISGRELVSLVITIKLFHGMGGRVLTPFNRLGYKIREQLAVMERASRDLVGVKQAFVVIFGLAVLAPVGLGMSDPEYIANAMKHPVISYVMQGAMATQLICFMAFKRFTSIKV